MIRYLNDWQKTRQKNYIDGINFKENILSTLRVSKIAIYDRFIRDVSYFCTMEIMTALYFCLFAVSETNRKFPVLVLIHGESYEWNSGNPYDGTVLASYGGLLVVTINYRLGVLGMLTFELLVRCDCAFVFSLKFSPLLDRITL